MKNNKKTKIKIKFDLFKRKGGVLNEAPKFDKDDGAEWVIPLSVLRETNWLDVD